MGNEDGTIQIVFNGEIYNYIELREELTKRGHVFRTRSDTEVIIHLYEEKGEDFPLYLNGMFAIALWDRRQRRMILVRDPLGIKPLFWMRGGFSNDSPVIFASELKCFLPLLAGRCRPNYRALAAYLHLGYVPREATGLEGIQRLLPGHMLVFSSQGGVQIRHYWRLRDCFNHREPIDRRHAITRIAELLWDAVRIRLRSDVPLGTFLSGGLDSSTVTAVAARYLPQIDSYSIRFSGHFFDETPYARVVSRHVGSRHREIPVDPDGLLEQMEEMAWHLDEPNWDPAVLPSYVICREARKSVKVALSGIGGDELFGGYHRHLDPPPRDTLACRLRSVIPSPLRRYFQLVGKPGSSSLLQRVARLGYDNNVIGMGYWVQNADLGLLSHVAPWAVAQFDLLCWIDEVMKEAKSSDWVNSRLYYDATTYLPDQILAMTDRASMAVSLEVRVPFLDRRLVEFLSGLPGDFKVRPGEGKLLLKDVVKDLLPEEILTRRKLGFGAPVRRWILDPRIVKILRKLPQGVLAANGIIDGGKLIPVLESQELLVHHSAFLWSLLMLELWYRQFVEKVSGERSK